MRGTAAARLDHGRQGAPIRLPPEVHIVTYRPKRLGLGARHKLHRRLPAIERLDVIPFAVHDQH